MATAARTAGCVTVGSLLLASCSSPPKPPSVDESTRRPVNARAAVDLRACQGDLSRATILVSEMARAGVTTAASQSALPPRTATAGTADASTADGAANVVAIVPFGIGSSSMSIEQADAAALLRRAKGAVVIMIRGRTDAASESLQQTALARRRAEAAAEFLQVAGVPKERLRLTWQGAGDPVGPGATALAQSRRVEIKFYAAAPVIVSVRSKAVGESRDGAAVSVSDRVQADTAATL